MINLLNNILIHDKVVIITNSDSHRYLTKLLTMIKNYLGQDNYIEHNKICNYYQDKYFEDFVAANKNKGKRIISTAINSWISNSDKTWNIFNNAKFILPYRGISTFNGANLPMSSIPTKLSYSADLILHLYNSELTIIKMRNNTYMSENKIYLNDLLLEERHTKVNKIKQLIR